MGGGGDYEPGMEVETTTSQEEKPRQLEASIGKEERWPEATKRQGRKGGSYKSEREAEVPTHVPNWRRG